MAVGTGPDDVAGAGEPAIPGDLDGRTEGELLAALAGAADRRRAAATTTAGPEDSDRRIADLEAALVSELRSRRTLPPAST